jgi:hypothetical protein
MRGERMRVGECVCLSGIMQYTGLHTKVTYSIRKTHNRCSTDGCMVWLKSPFHLEVKTIPIQGQNWFSNNPLSKQTYMSLLNLDLKHTINITHIQKVPWGFKGYFLVLGRQFEDQLATYRLTRYHWEFHPESVGEEYRNLWSLFTRVLTTCCSTKTTYSGIKYCS